MKHFKANLAHCLWMQRSIQATAITIPNESALILTKALYSIRGGNLKRSPIIEDITEDEMIE